VYRLTGQPDRSATAPSDHAPVTVAPRAVAAVDGASATHAAGRPDAGND
jgi:hypothetical protein